jgi:hypothetical protein
MTKRLWRWLWAAWLALFLILEGIAVADPDRGDTLSEQVWALITSNPGLWGSAVAILLGWLAWHFLIEPRWPKYPPRPKDDDR